MKARIFNTQPGRKMWDPMHHLSWCIVVVAMMSIEDHPAKQVVNAYASASKNGIVFA